jgi:hypothetical protein
MVTLNKSHTEDPQISGATIKNLVTMATCYLGFVRPWSKMMHGITVWRKKQIWKVKLLWNVKHRDNCAEFPWL